MTFHCIALPVQPNIASLLATACAERQIAFNLINPQKFDYIDHNNTLANGDLLYRITTTRAKRSADTVELFLLHPEVATLYRSYERAISQYARSFIAHNKAGLPIPKTIPALIPDQTLLKKYVQYVGGFPVIIKATGGSHGVGVMKVDSMESLVSIIDYLHQNHEHVIMRQFVDVTTSARFIVLGDKVVSSIEYAAPDDDFRSNVGQFPNVKPKQFSPSLQKLAVKATHLQGIDFGGVDILIDNTGQPFITEVNFPCNFARAQKTTGVDIAGLMVDFLLQKSSQLTNA